MSSRFFKYKKNLGFIDACKFYASVKLQKPTTLHLQCLKHPVHFRGNYSDYAIFEQIFIEKQYKLPITTSVKSILDLGANVGYASLYFASLFKEATIFALEPELNNYKAAKLNTALYTNINLVNGAIWHTPEQICIVDNGYGEAGYMIQQGEGKNLVKAYTIPEIMKLMNFDVIDILKVDIEGAEKEIFETNSDDWLPKCKIIIVETHDRYKKGTSKAIFNAIGRYDFSLELNGENLILINNNFISAHNV